MMTWIVHLFYMRGGNLYDIVLESYWTECNKMSFIGTFLLLKRKDSEKA